MDTVHDLGGIQGFGPIPNTAENDTVIFSEEWKARIWAIAMMSMTKLSTDRTGWTLDWFRHVIERLPPDLYLRLDYFDKWNIAVMATLVDEGVADVEEFLAGKARGEGFDYKSPTPVKEVLETKPRFKLGERVVAQRDVSTNHTRLAGYIRGRTGVVDSVMGLQPLPDLSAIGVIRNEHTYVVRFPMAELWPEASGSRDSLLIDMWDSYLEPV